MIQDPCKCSVQSKKLRSGEIEGGTVWENSFRDCRRNEEASLTTIIGIKCKDGIVMAADTQATEPNSWEYSIKVKEIDKFSLMACAGTAGFIEMFADEVRDEVKEQGPRDYKKVLEDAVVSYSEYMNERIGKVGLGMSEVDRKKCYPEVAIAAHDRLAKGNRIFEIKTPYPPVEPDFQQRVIIGSGSLPAVTLLKNLEFFMAKFELAWNNISGRLASQFCWLLMNRVEHVDPSTSGALLYRVDETGWRQLTVGETWGDQWAKKPWTSILLETAVDEISKNERSKGKLDVMLKKINPFEALR